MAESIFGVSVGLSSCAKADNPIRQSIIPNSSLLIFSAI